MEKQLPKTIIGHKAQTFKLKFRIMKTLKIFSALLIGAAMLIACEKEEAVSPITAESVNNVSESKTVERQNKLGLWMNLIIEIDANGDISCPDAGNFCQVIDVNPTSVGAYFNSSGEYIDGSFDDDYTNAVSYFNESPVDKVMDGDFYVELHENSNNSKKFVRFFETSSNDHMGSYQYE